MVSEAATEANIGRNSRPGSWRPSSVSRRASMVSSCRRHCHQWPVPSVQCGDQCQMAPVCGSPAVTRCQVQAGYRGGSSSSQV